MTPKPAESPRTFLDPRTLAKLSGLKLRARRIVEGFVTGLHRSPRHGFSIEFAQHREYTPGDDLRYLDWKAFGRTDKLYIKQFEDETNLICYIVLDVSESMAFRSDVAPLSKLEYAQCIVASLAWLVLKQQDAVGLFTFENQLRASVGPSTNPAQLQQIIDVLEATDADAKSDIGPVLHELAERFPRRGIVVILSDLLDDVDSVITGLKHLRHRGHEVGVLHVLDPAEVDFPFDRPTLFKGLEQRPEVMADPRSIRGAYLKELGRFLHSVKSHCRDHQLDYQIVRTDNALDAVLSRFVSSA